jgi:peptide/nickel transport system permease protein
VSDVSLATVASEASRARRGWPRGTFLLALAVVGMLLLVSVLVPVLAPYNPLSIDLRNKFAAPSLGHLLGTDNAGRDVLSRLMWGTRPALLGVAIALCTAAAVGLPWGACAGYVGGRTDAVLMRGADAILVFPGLILALVLTAVLGPSLRSSMVALGIVYAPVLARVTRAGVLGVRDREFVTVTRLFGLSPWHRLVRHVLPNATGPIVVQVTLLAGMSLLAQTGLGFLGVGLQPPEPSWGQSLAESFQYIVVNPEATIAPGLTVVLTVLAFYRVGDELRDRLSMGSD